MSKNKEVPAWRLFLALVIVFSILPLTILGLARGADQRQERVEVPWVPERDPHFAPRFEYRYSFEMTEGYFFIERGWPVHLMHDPIVPQVIQQGEKYSFWVSLAVRDDETNPCSRQREDICRFEYQLIPGDVRYRASVPRVVEDFSLGDDGGMHFVFKGSIPLNSPTGEVKYVVRARKGDDVLYVYELRLRVVPE